jgi:sec-independent protein translocase protein TatA
MGIFDWKHWVVILIVVVLVFGTKKLKNLGTDVGESIKGFRKAMNDDEKPAEPSVTPPAQPVPPVQPQTTAQANPPHTIDVQAQKVEEPIRKDPAGARPRASAGRGAHRRSVGRPPEAQLQRDQTGS